MKQSVGQPHARALPRLPVHVEIIDLVLASAAHVFLQRQQHVVEDRVCLGCGDMQRRLDPWPELVEHAQEVVRRVVESHERAPVIEQHALDPRHAHILMLRGKTSHAPR